MSLDPFASPAPSVDSDPQILTRDDGTTIAYHCINGKSPGVIFLTGFKSDMAGGKALALEALCQDRGQAFLRFDYFGHGESSGLFKDGTIGLWAEDAVYALDHLTEGPQVLVGSSMGGWIMLLAALQRPQRVTGLVGIAAAPDFTEDLIVSTLTEDQNMDLVRNGFVEIPNCYDDQEPYRIEQLLLDEGRGHLLLRDEIKLDMPIRLIHGMKDEDVPWQTSLKVAELARTDDVEITFVKDGSHRLSDPHDLERLSRVVSALLDEIYD